MHSYFDRRGRRRHATPWLDRQPSRFTIITAVVLVPLAVAATGDGAGPGLSLADIASWVVMAAWWALIALWLVFCVTAAVLLAIAVVVWIAGLHLETDR